MFTEIVDRKNTNSAKWDELIQDTGEPDIIPLTVADMDFKTAPEIVKATATQADHGIYGYTNVSKDYLSLTRKWIVDHYFWQPEVEEIVFCPRIINALAQIVQNFTNQDDKVLIFTPLYDPIQSIVKLNDRNLIHTSLVLRNNRYEIDFADLENKLRSGVKLMIVVSPHNPTGRVWQEKEIEKIVALAKKYNVLIFADEVHADFVWEGKFTSFGKFLPVYDQMMIGVSPAKTFNIPGIEAAAVVIKNTALRERFIHCLRKSGFHNPNFFCNAAVEAAYGKGEEWLARVKTVILENRRLAIDFINNNMRPCRVVPGEGTFLLWVDYTKLNISEEALKEKFIHEAKVACSMGKGFGPEGAGFFRINIAQPYALLKVALKKISEVIEEVRV